MPSPSPSSLSILDKADRARLIGCLAREFRDLERAEDALQEAILEALEAWSQTGSPEEPGAWLLACARRRALDRLRAEKRHSRALARLEEAQRPRLSSKPRESSPSDEFPDARLGLILACCHPSLSQEARVMLTLNSVAGLYAAEIARAFLAPEATLAQKLVRAKRKIRDAGIPFEIPPQEVLAERMDSVLGVLYQIFNAGYAAKSGQDLQRIDLCQEAIQLAKVVVDLCPKEPEAYGLLSLFRLQHSRRKARSGHGKRLLRLADQDRRLWDLEMIREGISDLDQALKAQQTGPYQIMAAIAVLHATAPTPESTAWAQIVRLYDLLLEFWPTPVVRLNRAVALSMAEGPAVGLAAAQDANADGSLTQYQYFHAVRGELLSQLQRTEEARSAYAEAIALAHNGSEREHLEGLLRGATE